ncbi:hypothetical protein BSL78_29668 [Apostichopus japonicus]|uniref:Ig-like domain-containing protein n=1 Tax=Stichopus japonicus TaxID=307972 RepID=A0A2G8JCP4_STIJA|nr:hypothetical protein BSL78_29668 [Apostichopus japonicus]
MASLLFISLLIHVSHAFFIPIIIVRIDGETDVFETGILEYTILNGTANFETETLTILCRNIAYGDDTSVVLERKGENPQVETMSMGLITARLDRNCAAESSCEGKYTCSVNISQQTAHGVAYTYTMKRTFQIRQASVIACKSRVGTTVILQEVLTFLCVGNNISWNRNNMIRASFTISQTNTDVSCGKYENNTWVETCATEIIVKPLEIEILPKHFTSSTPLLQFNCSSYPPRLMYWAVYSTNGNLLDAGNQNQAILVNTTISIDQSIGFTSISITEDIPGGNDIQEVICLTYDTQMAVAIAHLVTDDSPPVTDNFHQSTSTTDN